MVAAAKPASFWLDDPRAPAPAPKLTGDTRTGLCVIGAGFTGLWTALLAKQANPGLDVVVVEKGTAACAATGRNGGFCEASLTHGDANGRSRFPGSFDRLQALGQENLDAIGRFVSERRVDCGFERRGTIAVATEPWQLTELRGDGAPPRGWLDRQAVQAEIRSPTYLGGLWDREGCALVNPARLAWGIREACLDSGVELFEQTPAIEVRRQGAGVCVTTPEGRVLADRVALATNAEQPFLARVRLRIVPVYDYVLVTEPLDAAQLAEIGWRHRQGVSDSGNRFHYYRLTEDNRVLWGGWDAVYYYGRKVKPAYDQRARTFHKLARHLHETFPSLVDVRFTHRWGGAIDTCSRFCAFFGTALGGRLAYAAGYTGLGVGASRFGAEVMLDLLEGQPTERTQLELVRRKPVPFPPEPLAWAVVQATRWSIAWADTHGGKRNAWLRLLDRAGLGFDS